MQVLAKIEGLFRCRCFCRLYALICLFGLLIPLGSAAETDLVIDPSRFFDVSLQRGGFTVPNEIYPLRAKRIFEKVPAGTYVSVGTERGFIGAANSPNVDALVLVDYDPAVVLYNQVNILLLAIARDREHYLALRRSPGSTWRRAIENSDLSDRAKLFLIDQQRGWEWAVSGNRRFDYFHGRRPGWTNRTFREVNYLFDDALFDRLQTLARNNRIRTYRLDLSAETQLETLVEIHQANNLQLGALDISNAFWGRYMSTDEVEALISSMNSIAQDSSVLLVTQQAMIPTILQALYEKYESAVHWQYHGYTFERIRRSSSVHNFIWWDLHLRTSVTLFGTSYFHSLNERGGVCNQLLRLF